MTTEYGLTLPSKIAKYIDRLRARIEWLQQRINGRRSEGWPEDHNGFDLAELEALQWAIPVLEVEHLAAIGTARRILAAGGITDSAKQDSMIQSGHPR